MIEGEFHQMASDFIQSLIRQRKYLILNNKSKANPGFINDCLLTLDRYLCAYSYDTDEKMANFWINHCQEIFALIPGKDCSSHRVTVRNYYALGMLARNIRGASHPHYPGFRTLFN